MGVAVTFKRGMMDRDSPLSICLTHFEASARLSKWLMAEMPSDGTNWSVGFGPAMVVYRFASEDDCDRAWGFCQTIPEGIY